MDDGQGWQEALGNRARIKAHAQVSVVGGLTAEERATVTGQAEWAELEQGRRWIVSQCVGRCYHCSYRIGLLPTNVTMRVLRRWPS